MILPFKTPYYRGSLIVKKKRWKLSKTWIFHSKNSQKTKWRLYWPTTQNFFVDMPSLARCITQFIPVVRKQFTKKRIVSSTENPQPKSKIEHEYLLHFLRLANFLKNCSLKFFKYPIFKSLPNCGNIIFMFNFRFWL